MNDATWPEMFRRVIHIHPDAPEKPALGRPCNGCGVCCLDEPCPVGMVVSRRRRGACSALEWQPMQSQYRCGMAAHPQAYLTWLPAWAVPWAQRGVLRWIAAAKGCDSTLEVQR
jgi:hypothetical protein